MESLNTVVPNKLNPEGTAKVNIKDGKVSIEDAASLYYTIESDTE